jgi:methionine-rich copper-binding protein CopC
MSRHIFLVLAAAGAIAAGPAWAHAKLQRSLPDHGAKVTEAPKTLTLSFSESVQLAALSVSTRGKPVPVIIDRVAAAATTVTVPLPALAPGDYEVRWTALSPSDGHAAKGSLVFTILPLASDKH